MSSDNDFDDTEYVGGDEELEDADVDEQEDRAIKPSKTKAKKSRLRKSKKSELVDDAAESDEDDEEDDEEEDEVSRKKKRKRSQFIDDIAGVDDDEEEDDEEGEAGFKDFVADDNEAVGEQPYYPHRERAGFARFGKEDDGDEEADFEKLAERWNDRGEEEEVEDRGATAQQALLPTVESPRLWVVHCRPGSEREAAIQLLQKCYSTVGPDGAPTLLIKSAVALDHLKGYFYVEAEKETHVRDAIRGLRTIFAGKKVKQVPLNEMVDSITINRKAANSIEPNSWVRVKGGLYKDDLGKVVEVDASSSRLTVHILPRVDLAKKAQERESNERPPAFGRQKGVMRPPAKAFSSEEARKYGLYVEERRQDGATVYFLNTLQFTEQGYLIRNLTTKSVVPIEGLPDVEELTRFNAAGRKEGPGGDSVSDLLSSLPPGKGVQTLFGKGDKVEVVAGDLLKLTGQVVELLPGNKVLVQPHLKELKEPLEFSPDQLRKFYGVGDTVMVVGSRHTGKSGMVVNVKDGVCTLLVDGTKEQASVFSRDLTAFTGAASTRVEMLGPYSLHELVQLTSNMQGVIIRIEKDSARVLTTGGTPSAPDIRTVRQADITRKLVTRYAMTSDINGNTIGSGEPVTIQLGPTKGRKGTVEYIARGHLFIKVPGHHENSGFLCVPANQCLGRMRAPSNGANAGGSAAGAPPDVSRTPGRYAPQSPAPFGRNPYGGAAPMPGPPGGGGGGGGFGAQPSFGRASQAMVGKTVTVARGGYRGYKGRVKHETASHVQLELDALFKVVTVSKTMLRSGDVGGADPRATPGRGPAPSTPYHQPRTPLHPSATPMHPGYGGATPLHPSMTPRHPSTMTPMHPSMMNNPSPDYGTPGGGQEYSTAPTPGGPPAQTPGFPLTTYQDPYSATYTPAATPGAAPTPGGDFGAPSPHVAGTPGPAPTPGLPASTPFDAPTPAISPDGPGPSHTPYGEPYAFSSATPGLPSTTPAMTPGVMYTPADDITAATPDGSYMTSLEATTSEAHIWKGILVACNDGTGVVRSVGADGHCVVQPGSWDSAQAQFTAAVGEDDVVMEVARLEAVVPKKNDSVRVLRGPRMGSRGTASVVDSDNGMVFAKVGHDLALTVHGIGDVGVMVAGM